MKIATNHETLRQPAMRGDVTPRVREALPSLKGANLQIAQLLLDDPASVTVSPIGALAALTGTSAASITRFCQVIGVASYPELRLRLASELGRTGAEALLDPGQDGPKEPSAVTDLVARSAIRVLQRAAEVLDETQIAAAAKALHGAARIVLWGIGGSATVTQEMHLRLHRVGLPAWAPGSFHDAMVAAALMGPGDVLLAVSRSGRTAEVLSVAEEARAQGASVIVLTSFRVSALAGLARHLLLLPAEDLDTGHGMAAVKYGQMLFMDALYLAVARLMDVRASDALARTARALAPYRTNTRNKPKTEPNPGDDT